jgi:hypothetical protein
MIASRFCLTCRLMVPCTSQFSQPPSLLSTQVIFSSTAMNTGSLGSAPPPAITTPAGGGRGRGMGEWQWVWGWQGDVQG